MSTAPNEIPKGYRADARGRLVHESLISPIDQARDQLVQELVAGAKHVQADLVRYKRAAFQDIEAFVALSAEQYGVRIGGQKGNVTLFSFDGRFKIIRAVAEHLVFDERLQAAKELIDACLREWTEGARPEVVTIVQDAFRTDASGNVRTRYVLELRRLAITDPRWQQAMAAIAEAVQVVGSKSYIRLYERDAKGQYQPISLDMAGV